MVQYFEIDTKKTEEFIALPPAPRQKDYHELMWLEQGAADFIIDGDLFHVLSPAFFIMPRGRYHQFLPNQPIKGQVVRFSEDFIDDFPRLLFSKFASVSEIKIEQDMQQYFDRLLSVFKTEYEEGGHNVKVIGCLLKSILYKLDDIKNQQFRSLAYAQSVDLFDRFQILLDRYIVEERTVSFYAKQLNISPRKLGETIRALINHTTENVISQRLLIEAKRQLIYSDKNIAEIAYYLNFQDNSYFSKFFKKQTHMSPKQYRALLQA